MDKFVFTCGDINGIGPEIAVKVFNEIYPSPKYKIIFVSPANTFFKSIEKINPKFEFELIKPGTGINDNPDLVTIVDLGEVIQDTGFPTKYSGEAAFAALKLGFSLVDEKKAGALITNPISKYAFELAGINFPGHTEMLAEWSGEKDFAMMFVSGEMNAALATIHEPVKNIAGLITEESITQKLRLVERTLRFDFAIENPKIAVLGLNPHAGEQGRIGQEEETIIEPVLKKMNNKNISGPFVPDAFFANKKYKDFDIVFGMYHDQVLIPFKMLNFNSGVNFTAGLPIIRTSPDHGTAFDIAGKNIADHQSLLQAFYAAEKILKVRNKN